MYFDFRKRAYYNRIRAHKLSAAHGKGKPMARIKFIVDSSCDIPQELRTRYDISVVPITVSFGDAHYSDGEDLDSDRFFEMLKSSGELPKTAQPSPFRFEQEFRRWGDEYPDIICVCVSSRLSGTYGSALVAKRMLEEDPDFPARVHVIDSLNVSAGILVTVLCGAQCAAQDLPADEVVRRMEDARRRAGFYFILDTLEYARRGGRIGVIKAVVGGLLNIKPVLTIQNGVVEAVDRARGLAQGREKLVGIFMRKAADLKNVIVVHTHCRERAELLAAAFTEKLGDIRVRVCQVGATIGVFTGEGGVGFAVLEKEPRTAEA